MTISTILGREALAIAFLITNLLIVSYSSAERVRDKIYSNIQSQHYCSRRLNATHQMGCTSDLGGNFGTVWIVDSQDDIEHVLKTGPTPPYIVILNREHYTRKNLLEFKSNTGRVSGVVFLDKEHEDSKSRSSPFSPDDTCPNRYSGLYFNDTRYSDCKLNVWQRESSISGLLYDDIPFPIFLINDKKSIEEIETCFNENNVIIDSTSSDTNTDHSGKRKKVQGTYPLCSMQLDSFMTAASNSKLCLNSHSLIDELLQSNGRRCNPVDNHNIFAYYKPVYGPLHPNNGTNLMTPDVADKHSVVMLITKLSSLSMFTEISPGADSTITSIVTLLAVAEALNKVRNSTEVAKSKRNIAFALLDSEPFDYTGSSRMVLSMLENSFPNSNFVSRRPNITIDAMQNINLSSIDYVINLDQISNYPSSDTVYFHADPDQTKDPKLSRLYETMSRIASSEQVKLERVDKNLPLPPAPVQQFIRESRSLIDENHLVGSVLSNYDKTYSNLLYNSIYDDSHNIYQTSKNRLVEHIAHVAKFVARSVLELAFEAKKSDDISVSKENIKQLLDCYLTDAGCKLFTQAWQAGEQLPSEPIQTYKDPIKRSDDMNGAITSHLLAYFIGDRIREFNRTQCYEENEKSLIFNFEYVNGQDKPVNDEKSGLCIRSQVTITPAQSPAFSYNEDEGFVIDPRYPAWTVSLNGIRNPVRLYLKPSPIMQWCILFLGLIITKASFLIVYYIRGTSKEMNLGADLQTGTST